MSERLSDERFRLSDELLTRIHGEYEEWLNDEKDPEILARHVGLLVVELRDARRELAATQARAADAMRVVGELQAEAAIAFKLARHIRNTDTMPEIEWGCRGIDLLGELNAINPERYAREVKALAGAGTGGEGEK